MTRLIHAALRRQYSALASGHAVGAQLRRNSTVSTPLPPPSSAPPTATTPVGVEPFELNLMGDAPSARSGASLHGHQHGSASTGNAHSAASSAPRATLAVAPAARTVSAAAPEPRPVMPRPPPPFEGFDSSRSIRAALFGLTDMDTGVLSYPDPEGRVDDESMSLLPLLARAELFYSSDWVPSLQLSLAGTAEEGESAAVVGPAAVTTEPSSPAAADGLRGAAFADLLGRGKAVRFLLYQFLERPALWRDAAQELLDLAIVRAVERQSRRIILASDPHYAERIRSLAKLCRVRLSDHILRPSGEIVFYSPAVRAKLRGLAAPGDAAAAGEWLSSPSATWDAYVVDHRQDVSLLASPHRPPFSFYETVPSLTPPDLQPRTHTSSVDQQKAQVAAIAARAAAMSAAVKGSEQLAQRWPLLSDHEQNRILFGEAAAPAKQVLAEGIYVYEGGDADGDVVFSDLDTAAPSVAAAPPEAGNAEEEGLEEEEPEEQPQQGKADPRVAEELANARVYELDAFHAGLIEPMTPRQQVIFDHMTRPKTADGDALAGLGLDNVAAAAASPAPQKRRVVPDRTLQHCYLPGGHFQHSVTGVIEDVQLSSLWASFQAEASVTLIDTLAALGGYRSERLRGEIRVELASQAAVVLLFLARDEVRAVTPPEDTYHRLWAVHEELIDALCFVVEAKLPWLSRSSGGGGAAALDDAAVRPTTAAPQGSPSPVPELPPFATLPLHARASYTCFGAANVPSTLLPAEQREGLAVAQEPAVLTQGPFSLYAAYVKAAARGRGTPEQEPSVEALQVTYGTLPAEAKLAFQFPFPQSAVEEAEAAGRVLPPEAEEVEEVEEDEEWAAWEEKNVPPPPPAATAPTPVVPVAAADATATLMDELLAKAALELRDEAEAVAHRSDSIPLHAPPRRGVAQGIVQVASEMVASKPPRRDIKAEVRRNLQSVMDRMVDQIALELMGEAARESPTSATNGATDVPQKPRRGLPPGCKNNAALATAAAPEMSSATPAPARADRQEIDDSYTADAAGIMADLNAAAGPSKNTKMMKPAKKAAAAKESVTAADAPGPKRRGRPPKAPAAPETRISPTPTSKKTAPVAAPDVAVPKRRDGPPKVSVTPAPVPTTTAKKAAKLTAAPEVDAPKRRGRPPKAGKAPKPVSKKTAKPCPDPPEMDMAAVMAQLQHFTEMLASFSKKARSK